MFFVGIVGALSSAIRSCGEGLFAPTVSSQFVYGEGLGFGKGFIFR